MLPFLTSELQPIGGVIKTQPEDFIVEEIALHEPTGSGTHLYFLVEKRGMTTLAAAAEIAKALGRAQNDICTAGQKDARAIARQWMSIQHAKPEDLQSMRIPGIQVLKVIRNKRKLRTGDLKGNTFRIRIRDFTVPAPSAAAIASKCIAVLEKRGVPNYFGSQRFGSRSDSHILGEYIVKGRMDEFIDHFLGRPQEGEKLHVARARQRYDNGDFEGAFKAMPWTFPDHRRALKALVESGGDKRKAYNVIDKGLKKLLVSAFQSELFNQVLAARMPNIDRLLVGDTAYRHETGQMFTVTDVATEQPKCDTFEISPTGPLVGREMRRLDVEAGAIENPVIDQAGLTARDWEQLDNFVQGGRRPLRFRPRGCQVKQGDDEIGQYIELAFELDSGCYATTLLREVCKTGAF
jgi:tRNA pseudouridine13 synthase